MTDYIAQEAVETVRTAIVTAVNEGVPPARTALNLIGRMDLRTGTRSGGILGLDGQRAEQAQRVRSMLADKDEIRRYFIRDRETGVVRPRYTTTDRRFDSMVRNAIADGRALSPAEIDRIGNRHVSRLLDNRAKQIAHDSPLTSLRAGQHDGFRELVGTGAVLDEQMERIWLSASDNITRPDHRTMHGQKVVGMDAVWTFPDGSQALYPGDSSLGAPIEQTTQCRCVEVVRIIPKSNLEQPATKGEIQPAQATPLEPMSISELTEALKGVDGESLIKIDPSQDKFLERIIQLRERIVGNVGTDVVDEATFKAMPGKPIYRGVARATYVEDNVNGAWIGHGVYGNGNYFASNIKTSHKYMGGDNGWIYSSKLKADARIISIKDASNLKDDFLLSETIPQELKDTVGRNISRVAAFHGYDAIEMPVLASEIVKDQSTYTIVFNNRALVTNGGSLPNSLQITERSVGIDVVERATIEARMKELIKSAATAPPADIPKMADEVSRLNSKLRAASQSPQGVYEQIVGEILRVSE